MQKLLTTFVLFAMTAICSTASSAENAQDLEIERAARAFRIATYDSFRLNRDLYDARREAGDGLLTKWHEAGAPDEFRLDVLNWFGHAAELPAGSPLPPMPALPEVPPAPAAEPKPVAAAEKPVESPQIELTESSSRATQAESSGALFSQADELSDDNETTDKTVVETTTTLDANSE